MERRLIITDIGVATYLIYLEFSFEFDMGDEGIVVFKFPSNKKIKKAIEEYNSNKTLVDPKKFISLYKRIIVQIFNLKKQYKNSKKEVRHEKFNSP